ncbi:Flocculation suppression protein [Rhodotorula kratochvilovae]
MTSNVPGNPLAAPSAAGGLPPAPGRSPRGSPELDAAPEHDEDDDRDELEDEVDDAASSEGRARSPEADAAPAAPAVDPVSAAASKAARTALPPTGGKTQAAFVHKVWSMVETPALQNLISWAPDGKSFLVYSPEEFARTVLPQFFKHSNFASFLRQLNFYSWSKVNDVLGSNSSITKPDGTPVQAWEFRNPNFQRGRPDLLARIKRKTAKSNAAASPASSRRRSSVTTLTSLRPSRREATFTAASNAGQSAEEERDGEGTTSSSQPSQPPAGPPSSSRQSVREESSAAPSKRVAAGLAEFAPYGGEPSSSARVKEENDYAPSGRASPPYPRQPPPPPQPAAYAPSHQYSPGTRAYGLPPTTSYSGYRYSYSEEPLARQVHALEGQVRSLSDALYYSQQEFVATRTASYGVLQSMLSVVASLDPEGRKRDEIQAASAALAKLSPDASPHYPYPNPFAYSFNPSGWPASHAFPSPRPSTAQSASQFYYNRIPAAESYTRTSRSDSRTDPAAPAPRPATQPAPSMGVGVFASSSSTPYDGTKHQPPTLPPPHASSRPQSAGAGSNSASYPSPRLSWGARPDSRSGGGPPGQFGTSNGQQGGDGKGGRATTTLPPLSSLLNPAGGPAPPHSFGGERRLFDAPDDADERAHKKQRQ